MLSCQFSGSFYVPERGCSDLGKWDYCSGRQGGRVLQYGCNFITECDSVLVVHRIQGAYAEMFPGVLVRLGFLFVPGSVRWLSHMVSFFGSCSAMCVIGIGIIFLGFYWI